MTQGAFVNLILTNKGHVDLVLLYSDVKMWSSCAKCIKVSRSGTMI